MFIVGVCVEVCDAMGVGVEFAIVLGGQCRRQVGGWC